MTIDSTLAWPGRISHAVHLTDKSKKEAGLLTEFNPMSDIDHADGYSWRKDITRLLEHQPPRDLCLENRYFKLKILPEVGGQVQIAFYKTNNLPPLENSQTPDPVTTILDDASMLDEQEFIWHLPSTLILKAPLRWWFDEQAEDSKTIWCTSMGIQCDVRETTGFRLYPDRAYIEIDRQLYNPTRIPQRVDQSWGSAKNKLSTAFWLKPGEERRFTQQLMPFDESDPAIHMIDDPLEDVPHTTDTEAISYQETLRRDPTNTQCNNALGLLAYRRGRFATAEGYFQRAIKGIVRVSSTYVSEPFYYLGLALTAQGEYQRAVDAFYKASLGATLQDAAYFELARLACRDGQLTSALALLNAALEHNQLHHKARHLKIALLRRLHSSAEAAQEINFALSLNPFAYGILCEAFLLTIDLSSLDNGSLSMEVLTAANRRRSRLIGLALDYHHVGLWHEAIAILRILQTDEPICTYLLHWSYLEAGMPEKADALFAPSPDLYHGAVDLRAMARTMETWPPSHRLDALLALECAIHHRPTDAHAFYLLGTLWYEYHQEEVAITCWERARALQPNLPAIHRNLGVAYLNHLQDHEAALVAYERAFALNITDAEIFFELDQLYQLANLLPQDRLMNLELRDALLIDHDDLSLARIKLLNLHGSHAEALALLLERSFVSTAEKADAAEYQYAVALLEQAKKQLSVGDAAKAIDLLYQAQRYPGRLAEAQEACVQKNQLFYYLGRAYAALGQDDQAQYYFLRATDGPNEPTTALDGTEQLSEMLFYRALAHKELGDAMTAKEIFQRLIDYGHAHLADQIQVDESKPSLLSNRPFVPDLKAQNRVRCSFMMGLGYLGLGKRAEANTQFDRVLKLCSDHYLATIYRRMIAPRPPQSFGGPNV